MREVGGVPVCDVGCRGKGERGASRRGGREIQGVVRRTQIAGRCGVLAVRGCEGEAQRAIATTFRLVRAQFPVGDDPVTRTADERRALVYRSCDKRSLTAATSGSISASGES